MMGDFIDILYSEVKQMITIIKSQTVDTLINAIKVKLKLDIPLSIYQINPKSIIKKDMKS